MTKTIYMPAYETAPGQRHHDRKALQSRLDLLAHVESQILYRDGAMPEWADQWIKTPLGDCFFVGCGKQGKKNAPDYREGQDGPITLAIIDPPSLKALEGE